MLINLIISLEARRFALYKDNLYTAYALWFWPLVVLTASSAPFPLRVYTAASDVAAPFG